MIPSTTTIPTKIKNQLQGLCHMISQTPLLAIHYSYKGTDRVIYAKAEHLNFTGSTKDRMAFHILQKAYASGSIVPHSPIFEATSGNTGISFAAIGKALGHPVTIFMPEWMSEERKKIIGCLGAEIKLISKAEGGFLASIKRADDYAHEVDHSFLPHQFSNYHNCEAHYLSTGPEIYTQLAQNRLKPDAFVAGVGTGGTIMGVGAFLREKYPQVKIHPLEPSNSPTLSTGHKVGKHRIEGISDEFIPQIVDLSQTDEILAVDDGDAIIMAKKLAAEVGLGVGISSGANFIGAVMAQNQLGDHSIVTTIFPDDNKKYLSTDLLRDEPSKETFYSNDIIIHSFTAIERTREHAWDFS